MTDITLDRDKHNEYSSVITEELLRSNENNRYLPTWVTIEQLADITLYPSKLRRQIMNLHEGKTYKSYLGNEEIGDPEVID